MLSAILVVFSLINNHVIAASFSEAQCTNINTVARLDCFPEQSANKESCVSRGCCWASVPEPEPGLPMCYFPSNYASYTVTSTRETNRGYIAYLKRSTSSYGITLFSNIQFEMRKETKTRLRFRFTIPSDPNRWEPPIPLGEADSISPVSPDYSVDMIKQPFGLRIKRTNTNQDVLLDSTDMLAPSLIIADQFLQISFRLFVQRGFGPGELRTEFPHTFQTWERYGMWGRDAPPSDNQNLYGTHNFFMGLSHDGTAFGIFLLNSNAQEVALTPLPAITFRTIGGIFDFFVFTGPQPADVISQYYDLIGHPPLPPYWSLGFHLSRYGYKDLNEVATTLDRNLKAGVPIDAQWFDIDYMDAYRDWTVNEEKFGNMGEYVNHTLHEKHGIKAVLIVDPAISTTGGSDYSPYAEGLRMGVFINDSRTNAPLLGKVWPGETVFPDFSHPNAEDWWFAEAKRFHQRIQFDGLWIDMNEPASFDYGSSSGCDTNSLLDNPPFVPMIMDRNLYARTVCPSAKHFNTTHYNRHNLYGYDEARVTRNVLTRLMPGKRPFLLSRSSFAGSGRYAIHWTGDNLASWTDMRKSIPQLINFNMFGMPMIGADVCGFREQSTEELCVRWSQLGAFYPFSRNHNEINAPPQDPAVWSSQATKAIREAIRTRYFLLPYLYALMHRAHLNGTSVIRSLVFEFPQDLDCHSINEQFMLGSCLLINPVLYEGRNSTQGYVPAGEWINLSTGKRLYSTGQSYYFEAPLHVIPILARAGCILPMQYSAETTSVARKKGFTLFAILSTSDDGTTAADASGELFWDDGESDNGQYAHIKFTIENRTLSIQPTMVGLEGVYTVDSKEMELKSILIIGINIHPKSVVNGNISLPFSYDQHLNTVQITPTGKLNLLKPMEISWTFS